jgi:YggT family protein
MVNRHHPIVGKIYEILERIIDPLLRPIRRYIPDINGIDLSPVVLILAINFIQYTISYYTLPSITYQ